MGQALSLHRNVKTQRRYAILGRRISQRFFLDLPCICVHRDNTLERDGLRVRFSDLEATVSVSCPAPSSTVEHHHGCSIVRQLIRTSQKKLEHVYN
jgi:hypothetical protein